MTPENEYEAAINRLRTDVVRLARPEGRRVGSRGHDEAAAYLVGRLDEIGLEPYAGGAFKLPYANSVGRFANLVGVVRGRDRASPPVLIGAHYDTAGDLPGADDNAAAVAIALENARRLMARPIDRDVVIAIFDAADPPYFHS
jgi:acetylornithine deacetylase/succinyl-diaminopimelate desuccinylase-like protein